MSSLTFMVIYKENKNVSVLGRILTHLMLVFFQREFPANPGQQDKLFPSLSLRSCFFYVSIHICSDGLSSLIQNFFFAGN